MTLASDQKLDARGLSATSRKMLELRETVLTEWERRVRISLKEAKVVRHPIFIDTLPSFYDNIVEAISPDYPRANATDATSLASQHGEERARLTNYDLHMLILEYQIFRSTILDVPGQHGVALSQKELSVIHTSIDNAIRESVTAFSLVVATLREQFVAALTHDLRNPLASANMAAELIDRTSDSSQIKALAGRIIDNHRRMEDMIRSLLDTMAFQGGEKLRLDLSHFDILDVVHEVFERAAGRDGWRCEVVGEPVQGWWDRGMMARALENLVGNALKYGDPGTPVRVKVDVEHQRLILSVHNEGESIPPEEQEVVFQAFRRARAAKEDKKHGWGVGLPFVRVVAESHGGSVILDSTMERGTTFLLDIPVDARPFQNAPA